MAEGPSALVSTLTLLKLRSAKAASAQNSVITSPMIDAHPAEEIRRIVPRARFELTSECNFDNFIGLASAWRIDFDCV